MIIRPIRLNVRVDLQEIVKHLPSIGFESRLNIDNIQLFVVNSDNRVTNDTYHRYFRVSPTLSYLQGSKFKIRNELYLSIIGHYVNSGNPSLIFSNRVTELVPCHCIDIRRVVSRSNETQIDELTTIESILNFSVIYLH